MNLSDMFEYMSTDKSDHLFSSLSKKLVKDGRLVYWNLFANRFPPPNCTAKLLEDFSQELQKIDRVFFYSKFCVLQIT